MATDVEQQVDEMAAERMDAASERVEETMGALERPAGATVAAISGGILGGIAIGLLLNDAMPTIGGLVGVPTVLGGWALNMIIAVVLALVFAAAVQTRWLSRYASSLAGNVVLGAIYGGVILTIVTGGFVLPIWANAVLDAGFAVPTITVQSFLNHLVYGVVLGGVYGLVRARAERRAEQHSAAMH